MIFFGEDDLGRLMDEISREDENLGRMTDEISHRRRI